jgi:hypothetical protein
MNTTGFANISYRDIVFAFPNAIANHYAKWHLAGYREDGASGRCLGSPAVRRPGVVKNYRDIDLVARLYGRWLGWDEAGMGDSTMRGLIPMLFLLLAFPASVSFAQTGARCGYIDGVCTPDVTEDDSVNGIFGE